MANKTKTADLPGMTGKGVAPIVIPEIAKAANKYEKKKEQRCSASPGEIAAKAALRELLHRHRAELPLNEEGEAFYRHEGVDYILEEKLKRRAADDEGDAGEPLDT